MPVELKCHNCQSELGIEVEREINDVKIKIWKCAVCNGEHKISLKTQAPKDSHATKRADETPRTTGLAEIPHRTKPETSEHETTERSGTGSSSTKSE